MKLEEKICAIKLRKKGRSYSEIRKKIKVSKGTLSLWLKNIELTNKQKERLYITLPQKHAYKLAKQKQKDKKRRIQKASRKAQKEIPELMKSPLFLAGLMLYWAEGTKSEEREEVKFTNSDSTMIVLAMKWFRKICKVPEEKFRIAIHTHNLHARKNIEDYWSKITNVPMTQFHKTWVKKTSLKHRRNPLYNGTCAIRISDVELFRRIQAWKMGFLKALKINKKDALVA